MLPRVNRTGGGSRWHTIVWVVLVLLASLVANIWVKRAVREPGLIAPPSSGDRTAAGSEAAGNAEGVHELEGTTKEGLALPEQDAVHIEMDLTGAFHGAEGADKGVSTPHKGKRQHEPDKLQEDKPVGEPQGKPAAELWDTPQGESAEEPQGKLAEEPQGEVVEKPQSEPVEEPQDKLAKEEKPEDGEEAFHVKLGKKKFYPSESLDFSSEQGTAGLMWLPMGLHEVSSGDPWVTMCLMKYGKYKDDPTRIPMFAHLVSASNCGRSGGGENGEEIKAGSTVVVRMSSLLQSMKDSGFEPVPPKGFVYHETRCGSTLVANMLAALPNSRMFSESKPPVQAIRTCKDEGCSREILLKVLKDVVALMGRHRGDGEDHEHLYFKLQNSKFLPEISEAFPEVPWVFVFRDPVEVMVSNLKNLAAGPCVRIPRQEAMKGARPGAKRQGLQGKNEKLNVRKKGMFRRLLDWDGDVAQHELPLSHGGRLRNEVTSDGKPLEDNASVFGVREWGEHSYWKDDASSDTNTAEWSWEGASGEGISGMSGLSGWRDQDSDVGVSSHGVGHHEPMVVLNDTEGAVVASERMLLAPRDLRERENLRGRGRGGDRIALTKPSLTKAMCKECADWLKMLCDAAVDAGHRTPRTALFVDYSNLPEAVPEFVFPHHFGLKYEIDESVPNWKGLMYEIGGIYSKGGAKIKKVQFEDDTKAKQAKASPLIIEAAQSDSGLYDVYHTLYKLQAWHRAKD